MLHAWVLSFTFDKKVGFHAVINICSCGHYKYTSNKVKMGIKLPPYAYAIEAIASLKLYLRPWLPNIVIDLIDLYVVFYSYNVLLLEIK